MNTRTKNMLTIQPVLTVLFVALRMLGRAYPSLRVLTYALQGAVLAISATYMITVWKANKREGLTFKGNPRSA